MAVREDIEPIERYLFLLLFAPDATGRFSQPVRGNTWLQKELFVLSKMDTRLADDTDFDAYAMGAYSETVAEVQDQFRISGFVDIERESTKLTLEGRKEAERLWTGATEREKKMISLVKSWLNDLSFNELLAIVYAEYPESAAKSQVKGQVNARASELAVSLLRKNKVTPDLARKIAGLSPEHFERLLRSKGVTWSGLETSQVVLDAELMEDIARSHEDSQTRRLVNWEKMKQEGR